MKPLFDISNNIALVAGGGSGEVIAEVLLRHSTTYLSGHPLVA
ncbi:MAG: hypothetical protein ACI9UT_001548 [Flavobacteriales bacterium]|jgi:hypothetical protein